MPSLAAASSSTQPRIGSDGIGGNGIGSDGIGGNGIGSDGIGSDGIGSDGIGGDAMAAMEAPALRRPPLGAAGACSGPVRSPLRFDLGGGSDPLNPLSPSGGSTATVMMSDAESQPAGSAAPTEVALSTLGLCPAILANYEKRGITSLYQWQAEALAKPGVLDGWNNLIYTAPTSGGKTLVAEVLMMRRLLKACRASDRTAKALFVVPLKALVEEKVHYFEEMLAGSGLSVQRYMHGYGVLPMPKVVHVAVCTNEKAAMIIQSMAAGDQRAPHVRCCTLPRGSADARECLGARVLPRHTR